MADTTATSASTVPPAGSAAQALRTAPPAADIVAAEHLTATVKRRQAVTVRMGFWVS